MYWVVLSLQSQGRPQSENERKEEGEKKEEQIERRTHREKDDLKTT
jgi:hypothetical protein